MAHQRSRLYKPPYPFVRNDASSQAVGLVGWWPGEPNGGILWDMSSQRNHGTMNGFAVPYTTTSGWVSGKDGGHGALAFDGTNDYVSLAKNPPVFGTNNAFSASTFACWIKPNSGTCVMFDNRYDLAHVGYVFWVNTGNFLSCYSNPTGTERDGTRAVFGNWHHAALTLTSAGVGQMYLDGRPEGASITWTLAPNQPFVSLTLGKSFDPTFCNGAMEDIRFYNRVLSPSQIWKLYDLNTRWDLRHQVGRVVHYSPQTDLIRTTTDAPTISESATQSVSAPRTTTNAPTLSESVSIAGQLLFKTTTDSSTVSESVLSIATSIRTTSDAPTTSEAVVVTQTLVRNITDSPTLSDVAVVGNFFDRTAIDSPTISENITTNYVASKTANDSPTLSEASTTQKLLFKSISQSLTITHSNLVATPIQSVEQGLVLSHSVSVTTDISKSLESELFFSQSADYEQFMPTEISQSLTITQSADFVQTTGVGNELTITQDVAIQLDPHFDGASQGLTATQTVVVGAVFNRNISQPLTLVQAVTSLKIKPVSASNTLIIGQLLEGGLVRKAFNTLTVSQSVVKETFRNKSVNQSLAITQSVGLQMILNRSLVSTLVFKDEHPIPNGAGGVIQVPNLIHTRGGSTLNNCSCTVPSATTVFQSSTRAIVLPNPEYNDSEGLVAAVSIQKTITGQTYSYVKKSANRKLKYKFIISQRKAYELRRFLLDFLGERLTMTNWKGEIYTGYFLTDPAEITSSSRGGICTGDLYQIDLEFQGVRVN